jgi:hypothetical protein
MQKYDGQGIMGLAISAIELVQILYRRPSSFLRFSRLLLYAYALTLDCPGNHCLSRTATPIQKWYSAINRVGFGGHCAGPIYLLEAYAN